jgi:hypothetical protein
MKLKAWKDADLTTMLGTIAIGEEKTPVIIGNFSQARYAPKENKIEIQYKDLKRDDILADLEHEVGHLLDEKIKRKDQ